MIRVLAKEIPGKDLCLGFRGKYVHFRHRPYADRPEEHQEDYLRLRADISHRGIINPIITFDNHVLIGMRRYEIMMSIHGGWKFRCWEIQENVNEWTRADIDRLELFKSSMQEVSY